MAVTRIEYSKPLLQLPPHQVQEILGLDLYHRQCYDFWRMDKKLQVEPIFDLKMKCGFNVRISIGTANYKYTVVS